MTLGELVRAVEGASGARTGLAWVIRDDLTGIRILWEPQSKARVLPGDLVVLPNYRDGISAAPQGHAAFAGGALGPVAANSAESDRVQVAFVGIEARRPVIVVLPKRHATIAYVLDQLHQPPELAKTVNVIRTDSQMGRVNRHDLPVRLVDGDVLVFKRRQLNERDLAAAQANLATAFQHSRPLHLARAAASDVRPPTAGEWSSQPPSTSVDFGPSHVAPQLPHGGMHGPAFRESSGDANAIGAADRAKRQALIDAELSGRAPFGESLPAAITADHYSSKEPPHFSAMTGLAAAPIEPVSAAVKSTRDGPWESLSTVSIAFGVLALAGLCFMVSVAWIRIDRTVQTLQQSPSSRGTGGDSSASERKTLDQLIGNSVPMIEEQALLPNRMDYFGPELGRQRMIIDPPHEMAGPHFALSAARAKAKRSSRKPVMTVAAPQHSVQNGNVHTEARLVRAADQIRQRGRRRPRPEPIELNETQASEPRPKTIVAKTTKLNEAKPNQTEPTIAVADKPDEALPRVGLLERVLIAMERERRS